MVLLDLTTLAVDLPTWTPLGVAAVMMVALVLLWLSMRRHIKIARRDAPHEPDVDELIAPRESGAGGSVSRGSGAGGSAVREAGSDRTP